MSLDTQKHPEPQTTPGSSDFPVVWEQPDDAQLHWVQDRLHAPKPVPPLIASLEFPAFQAGWTSAARWLARPNPEIRIRCMNTYMYTAVVPHVSSRGEMTTRELHAEEALQKVISQLDTLWQTRWLPAIKEHLAYLENFDLQRASLSHLLTHLAETLQRRVRLWQIHFELVLPSETAVSSFEEFYRDLFPDSDHFEPFRLLEGFDNKSLERARQLWQLGREALNSPFLRKVFELQPADEIIDALAQHDSGRIFLTRVASFLAEFGFTCDQFGSGDSWLEDPTPVMDMLQKYVKQPQRNLEVELASTVKEREHLLARVRGSLKGYPQAFANQFEFQLRSARQGNFLMDEHNYWLDQRSTYFTRQVLKELARRLVAADVIDQVDDATYLTVDEIRAAASGLGAGNVVGDVDQKNYRAIITQRQVETAKFAKIAPPPELGTPPSTPRADSGATRASDKFWGTPLPPSDRANEITGHSGSPGIIRGPARVILSLDDINQIQAGDILVTTSTDPTWTPLFATVAGVVTDTGGILCHTACIAREYRIPTVVGTSIATSTIKNGQLIEVDGNTGIVRII